MRKIEHDAVREVPWDFPALMVVIAFLMYIYIIHLEVEHEKTIMDHRVNELRNASDKLFIDSTCLHRE